MQNIVLQTSGCVINCTKQSFSCSRYTTVNAAIRNNSNCVYIGIALTVAALGLLILVKLFSKKREVAYQTSVANIKVFQPKPKDNVESLKVDTKARLDLKVNYGSIDLEPEGDDESPNKNNSLKECLSRLEAKCRQHKIEIPDINLYDSIVSAVRE